MKYLVMCKVYTDVGDIKKLYHVCPPVRKIIHSLKLVDYLHVQADNPWYNYILHFLISNHLLLFQRKISEESRKASLQQKRRASILTRSDIKIQDSHQLKAQRLTTASRAKQIEEIRAQLFQATLDNDKANVRLNFDKANVRLNFDKANVRLNLS